jgi:hypothetical protein
LLFVTLVDVDHMPGVYVLESLQLRAAGYADEWYTRDRLVPSSKGAVFRIVEESIAPEDFELELEDPPDQDTSTYP